jgi:exodeoxyribonuclease V alpha subunit
VRLTEVFRQAAESRIIATAHRINKGQMPEWTRDPDSDFHFVSCRDPEDGVAKILEIVRERIPARFGLDPIRDIQVLCPMNRGGLGARALNLELQRVLNPPGDGAIQRFGWTFGVGDKVMQIENEYDKEVYNGDLGFVRAVDAEAGEVMVEFDGREVAYGYGELDELARDDDPQVAGVGVPGRGDPADYAALPHAPAQSALHGRHPGAGGWW